jgi:hypothetical protein
MSELKNARRNRRTAPDPGRAEPDDAERGWSENRRRCSTDYRACDRQADVLRL